MYCFKDISDIYSQKIQKTYLENDQKFDEFQGKLLAIQYAFRRRMFFQIPR